MTKLISIDDIKKDPGIIMGTLWVIGVICITTYLFFQIDFGGNSREPRTYYCDGNPCSEDTYYEGYYDYEDYYNEEDGDDKTFHGYDCTNDCSGHQAGYNWAEENNIYDGYECDNYSNSFTEGCEIYVREKSEQDHLNYKRN